MNLEPVSNALRRIWGAIRRFFRLRESAVDNTADGTDQPGEDESLEAEPGPTIKIQTDEDPPAPEPSVEKPEDPKEPIGAPDIPPEITPAAVSKENNKKKKKPQNRSGARGKPGDPKPIDRTRKPPPDAKPELICRETSTREQWQIFLANPSDKNITVRQGDPELSQKQNGEYLLLNFTETIHWSADEKDEKIELFDDSRPLIFKLRKNWHGDGRRVPHISNGHYLAFAPRNWHRTGEAPVGSSACDDENFTAHYFYSDGTGSAGGFEECPSFIKQERFSLSGTTVSDDADMGDLYVGDVPQLNDSENWTDVSWIRVGEEGIDSNWGGNSKPTDYNLVDVIGRREGWFYIRIYDDAGKLIYSTDFRYLAGLQEILVNEKPHRSESIIAPGDNGHIDTMIRFVGEVEVKSKNADITVNDNNTATIAPFPNLDKTQWTLVGKNGSIKTNITLPRIWWRLTNSDDESDEWKDTAYKMSQDAFLDNRGAVMMVRLPPFEKMMEVSFEGFYRSAGGRNRVKDMKTNHAKFDLREFCSHSQISERPSKGASLRIRCGGAEFPIVRIPADIPSPPPAQPPADELSANAIRRCKKRNLRPKSRNKRFSILECEQAQLTDADAKRLRVTVDSRRRTAHHSNVEYLRKKLPGENHAA